MGVVVASEACKGATLKGSILHQSPVQLLSVVVGLTWQGGARLSELRRLPLLQAAYLLALVVQQEHMTVCLW